MNQSRTVASVMIQSLQEADLANMYEEKKGKWPGLNNYLREVFNSTDEKECPYPAGTWPGRCDIHFTWLDQERYWIETKLSWTYHSQDRWQVKNSLWRAYLFGNRHKEKCVLQDICEKLPTLTTRDGDVIGFVLVCFFVHGEEVQVETDIAELDERGSLNEWTKHETPILTNPNRANLRIKGYYWERRIK